MIAWCAREAGGAILRTAVCADRLFVNPVLAISPHLDDAVFGCGAALAGLAHPTVVTVFAGVPDDGRLVTDWDRASGFDTSRECVQARRREDEGALGELGAEPRWLDFLDDQYRTPPPSDEIARSLEAEISRTRPRTVLMPIGLFHRDHVSASNAMLEILRSRPGQRVWVAYAEVPYSTIPGIAARRISEVCAVLGVHDPVAFERPPNADKARAMSHYRSQLRALDRPGKPGSAALGVPERYWVLR